MDNTTGILKTPQNDDAIDNDALINEMKSANAALQHDQIIELSNTLEWARSQLQRTIINIPEGLNLLVTEFQRQKASGVPISMLVFSSTQEPSQINNFNNQAMSDPDEYKKNKSHQKYIIDQLSEMENTENINQDSSSIKSLILRYQQQIHFSPVFLKEVSSLIISFYRKHRNLVGLSAISSNSKDTEDIALMLANLSQYKTTMHNARETMILVNGRLVTHVARRITAENMSFADLLQEGNLGLIKAVDRFNCKLSVRFSTYAVYWIRQSISRARVRCEKTVRMPYNLASKVGMVFAAQNQLSMSENKPSVKTIAEKSGVSEHDVAIILRHYRRTVSLNDDQNQQDDLPKVIESLEQTSFAQPFDVLTHKDLKLKLREAVATLPDREAEILSRRFGLYNDMDMTLQDIATHLSLTRERVRQIQLNALAKLKTKFGSELMDFLTPELSC